VSYVCYSAIRFGGSATLVAGSAYGIPDGYLRLAQASRDLKPWSTLKFAKAGIQLIVMHVVQLPGLNGSGLGGDLGTGSSGDRIDPAEALRAAAMWGGPRSCAANHRTGAFAGQPVDR
jgi:hypothetical protein